MINKMIDRYINKHITRREEKRQREMDKFEVEQFEGVGSGVDGFPGWLSVEVDSFEELIKIARRERFASEELDYLKRKLTAIAEATESMKHQIGQYQKARSRQIHRKA